jgi:DNA-binding NarL/FixJ family response regulator
LDSLDRFVGDGLPHWLSADADALGERGSRRLAIVDPSRLRRDCLKLALGLQARRWRVTDVAAAVELARLIGQGHRFAVIMLGASTCRQIRVRDIELLLAAAPRTPILLAADCEDRERALALLRCGTRGFLPTNLGLKVLLAALERVRGGGTYVPLALSQPAVAGDGSESLAAPWCALTRRQREVLALISQGLSNKLIAAALATTESTVKAHVKSIIKRLNVANRTQAALLAARAGTRSAGLPRALASVDAVAA